MMGIFDNVMDRAADRDCVGPRIDRIGLELVVPDPRRSGDLKEIKMPPLTCVCGSQTFSQIHCIEPGILALRCFACSKPMSVSVSAMAAEAAWERMEAEAPEPLPSEGLMGFCGVEASPEAVAAFQAQIETHMKLQAEIEAPDPQKHILLNDGSYTVSCDKREPAKPSGYKYPAML